MAPKAYASGVALSFFGLTEWGTPTMLLTADLLPVRETDKSTDFELVCPDCTDAAKLSQKYHCKNTKHGPFVSGEAARAKNLEGTLYKVTAEEIAALKEPQLPTGEMSVSIFPAEHVTRTTRPFGTVYRVRPKDTPPQIYAVLRDLVADQSKAFIGELTLRNKQKLFRIEAWNGQILLQELLRPNEIADADQLEISYDGKLLSAVTNLAEAKMEDFDPDAFRKQAKERAAALEAALKAGSEGTVVKAPKKTSKPQDDDASLLASLEAAVASAVIAKAS